MNNCVVCGCTDTNCSGCVERTGEACWWFGPDLCSACAIGMKGLSLWQPWAWFVKLGIKSIETRFWKTNYRGLILICAAQKYDNSWQRICSKVTEIETDICTSRILKQRGVALCVANLVDCRTNEKRDEDASMVRFYPASGRYSWVLENIRPVTPFAVRGRQGLFNVNESIL